MATLTCRHSFLFPGSCINTSCDYLVPCWRIMNLQEFLDYRTHCPLCDEKLKKVFVSRTRQINKDNNNYVFVVELKSLKRGQKTFYAEIIVDTITNDFRVEFKEKDGRAFQDHVPTFLINRFMEFVEKCSPFKIYAHCKCEKYFYDSQYFNLDFKSKLFSDLLIRSEDFCDLKINDNLYFNMTNFSLSKKTKLTLYKELFTETIFTPDYSEITVPLINFTSKNKIIDRIKNLLIFS